MSEDHPAADVFTGWARPPGGRWRKVCTVEGRPECWIALTKALADAPVGTERCVLAGATRPTTPAWSRWRGRK